MPLLLLILLLHDPFSGVSLILKPYKNIPVSSVYLPLIGEKLIYLNQKKEDINGTF